MRTVSATNDDLSILIKDLPNRIGRPLKDRTVRNQRGSMSADLRTASDVPHRGYLSDTAYNDMRDVIGRNGSHNVIWAYSYWTLVGAVNLDTGAIWETTEKFSRTTTRHMYYLIDGLRSARNAYGVRVA